MFTYSLPGKFGNGTAEVFVCSKKMFQSFTFTQVSAKYTKYLQGQENLNQDKV